MPDRQVAADAEGDFVRTLDRGLAVLRAFGAKRPSLTLSEAASATGISRAAARRLLLTLERLGYVGSEDGRRFALRPAVLDLGFTYLSSLPWWRKAQRLVGPLALQIGHPCAVGVLEGAWVRYVAYAQPAPVPGLERSVGTRLPAHATAIRRVLLAGLPESEAATILGSASLPRLTPCTETDPVRLLAGLEQVRRVDASLVDQELRLGLRSLGVPIRDRAGVPRAALSASFGVSEPADPWMLRAPMAETAAHIGLRL
ncbi:IclR family transcriptional regulator C-terminal domain-containing protein [Falsiroseomonas sp.]|uniref:IclR family transcriptional regulator domain-containing protein n=1 Tax=Falsiroseomonas sp. TaxID=2870721 RepID=UPI003563E2B3